MNKNKIGKFIGFKLIDNGVDGFKLDECDGSDLTGGWSFPNMSKFPSGLDGEQYHSLFGILYMQTLLEALGGIPTLSEVRNAGALAASYLQVHSCIQRILFLLHCWHLAFCSRLGSCGSCVGLFRLRSHGSSQSEFMRSLRFLAGYLRTHRSKRGTTWKN